MNEYQKSMNNKPENAEKCNKRLLLDLKIMIYIFEDEKKINCSAMSLKQRKRKVH